MIKVQPFEAKKMMQRLATVARRVFFFAFSLKTCRDRLHVARLVSKVSVQYFGSETVLAVIAEQRKALRSP